MNHEIIFDKYQRRGSDYHYKQIDRRISSKFNAYVLARYEIELELIKKIIKLKSNKLIKILDVGCGDGVIFYLLNKIFKSKNKNLKLFGIDSSELAIRVAKEKNPDAIFKISDVYNLPFEDDYFDLIISSDVIEHVSESEKMILEIKRVGKKNSFYIIGTPIKFTEQPSDKMHFHEFFPNEFKKILLKSFYNAKVIQSHRLKYLLLNNSYVSFLNRKKLLYRKIINFMTVYLKKNPFLKIKTKDNEKYSYMFGIGKIKQ